MIVQPLNKQIQQLGMLSENIVGTQTVRSGEPSRNMSMMLLVEASKVTTQSHSGTLLNQADKKYLECQL